MGPSSRKFQPIQTSQLRFSKQWGDIGRIKRFHADFLERGGEEMSREC